MDTESIRSIVRRKLAGGDLPREIGCFEGRASQGEQCDVCKEAVGADKLVIITTSPDRKLHVECLSLWDQERDMLPGAGSGSSRDGVA